MGLIRHGFLRSLPATFYVVEVLVLLSALPLAASEPPHEIWMQAGSSAP